MDKDEARRQGNLFGLVHPKDGRNPFDYGTDNWQAWYAGYREGLKIMWRDIYDGGRDG